MSRNHSQILPSFLPRLSLPVAWLVAYFITC